MAIFLLSSFRSLLCTKKNLYWTLLAIRLNRRKALYLKAAHRRTKLKLGRVGKVRKKHRLTFGKIVMKTTERKEPISESFYHKINEEQ